MFLVTSVCHITVKCFVAKQWNVDCKRKDRMQKTIPPSTSWLGVREDRVPESEDAVDG